MDRRSTFAATDDDHVACRDRTAERAAAAASSKSGRSSAMRAPAQPSLVGMSRDALAEALGRLGVPERQRRMRVQQIWHWLYVRGAQDFDAMTTLSKDLRAALARALHAGAAGNRRRADFGRRHAQMAAPAAGRTRRRAARGRMRLHPGDRPRHVVHFEPGRLHAQLHVLPYRHAAPGAQSDRRRNRRPGRAGARPARRLAPRRASAAGGGRRAQAPRLQHRHDGHGRAALQFRGGARRPQRHRRRRRA